MFFTEQKLRKQITELAPYRYQQRQPLVNLRYREDLSQADKYPPSPAQQQAPGWEAVTPGTHWSGRDRYLWLVTDLTVPTLAKGQELVLLFDIGKTGGGHNSGFESLLYINGEPYQGIDSNHQEAFLPDSYSDQTLNIALKLWSGLEGGGVKQVMHHHFAHADYAIYEPHTDDLYYLATNILDTIELSPDTDPNRHVLMNLLESGFARINWAKPGSEAFYTSTAAAAQTLNNGLDKLAKHSPIHVTTVGHTHIDVAWLWRLKHTREKSARSFATVLKLMERYDDYLFLQSQPQLYKYIQADYPELFAKIQTKVAEGTWEIEGGMWLESDCNIPSGESLIRQLLHGSQFIKQAFGKDTRYLWLPDVFGYAWALPQILKKSGIETFMTTKISWNQYNRMPHDTFIWRGIDGSEILTHFITTPDMGNSLYYTYNGYLDARAVKGIYENYRNKDVNQHLLLSFGYGDGGGGVNRDMLENRRRLDKIPGLPHVKSGLPSDYFKQLHETVATTTGYIHTWDGELYLEYHRGTYTSQAFVKQFNRKLELAYRDAEILHSLAKATTPHWHYPAEALHAGWEIILRNQFHDIIPGSSIHEVYEDARIEYIEAEHQVKAVRQSFEQNYVTPDSQAYTVFNTAGYYRSELAFVPETRMGSFRDSAGNLLQAEVVSGGYNLLVEGLPPLSSRVITFTEGEVLPKGQVAILTGNQVSSSYYDIVWNEQLAITSIYDKINQRHLLTPGGRGNYFTLYEDKPLDYDAWDIDLYHFQKSQDILPTSVALGRSDSLSTEVVFHYAFGDSHLSQTMVLYAHSPRIDFVTTGDWQERSQLLKAHFDIAVRATKARYQIQCGNVERNTHWNTSWDMAQFESVAHQWVDFSQREYGVALLNDCKYGHSVKDQTMSISLLKGADYPDPEADKGIHHFTYSLLPHRGDFIAGQVSEQAWSLNAPLVVSAGRGSDTTFFDLACAMGHSVEISAIKQAEQRDGLIIRLFDHTGSNRQLTLTPCFPWQSWEEVSLMEGPFSPTTEATNSPRQGTSTEGSINIELTPYAITTILVK